MKHRIPDEILSQHVAVLGKTGSGKTSTAKLAIEQVVAEDARVCILDPIKSDWWGLTSSRDGKRGGLPFHILGGPHGHVPLHSAAGKAIADVVATGALPLSIIDMAEFEPGGQARFFVDFAPTLLRKMRGVLYLVIEEAHLFAPKERSGIGAENLSIHWAKTLATAGRSKGVRLVLVTQRTQALHNALLGSCDTLIAHRLTAPADQEPVVKWLKANTSKEILEQVSGSLSSLKTGEGWICSGEAKLFERVHFPRIATYDNTATPTGDLSAREVKTAPVDPEKLRAIIGDAVDKAKAEDPRELRKQIAELKKQLATPPAPVPVQADTTALEARVKQQADDIKRLKKLAHENISKILGFLHNHAQAQSDRWSAQVTKVTDWLGQLRAIENTQPTTTQQVMAPTGARAHGPSRSVSSQAGRVAPAAATSGPSRLVSTSSDAPIGKGERIILTAVAQYPDGASREQLTILTGYKRSSRDTYLQRLQAAGLVAQNGTGLKATDAGIAALGPDFEPLPTGSALADYWLNRLGGGEKVVLQTLVDAGGDWVDRDAISAATDYKRSSRDTYLQRLQARKLVETERGQVRASAALFD